MSLERESSEPKLLLPELRREPPDPPSAAEPPPSRRGGLLIGVGMIMLLTLLVFLNMG